MGSLRNLALRLTSQLVVETVYRGGNPAAKVDETCGCPGISDGHDRSASEESAELDAVPGLFAGNGDDSDGRRLLVDESDSHFVCNDCGECFRRRVSRDGDHIQSDRADACHCL